MNKKNIIFLVLVAFILTGVNAAFANNNGFQVQSLTVDNNIKQDNSTSMNFSNEEFPQEEIQQPVQTQNNNYVLTPNQVYVQPNPYAYNPNYIEYRFGPYYRSGIGTGFNYKGFGYNYTGFGYNYGYSTSNKHPIYVTPPQPIPPPKPPEPRPPIKPDYPHHGGGHVPPHHK